MNLIRLIIFISFGQSLLGCSVAEQVEKETAVQIDIRTMYQESLMKKYKISNDEDKAGLDQVIVSDKKLQDARPQSELDLRAQTEVKITRKIAELDETIKKKNSSKSQLRLLDSDLKNSELKVLGLDKKLKANPENTEIEDKLLVAISNRDKVLSERDLMAELIKDGELKQKELSADIEALRKTDFALLADKERRDLRNAVVFDFMAMADFNYYKFKNELLARRAYGDTGFDLTELALSTAATLSGGLTSKTNLSAASTLLKGSRSSIDKNLFVEQTISTIINGIELRREEDRRIILGKMEESSDKYPISLALGDVQRYQSHASLISGAVIVANETAKSAIEMRARMNK